MIGRHSGTELGGLTYCGTLFQHVPPGQIEVRLIVEERGGKLIDRRWYESPEGLTHDLQDLNYQAQENNAGVFVGVLPRKDKSSGMASNVLPGHVVWVDIDFKDFTGGEAEARGGLLGFPIKPSMVVSSGHGLHAYWLLRELTSSEELSGISRRLAKALGADHAFDPSRILRLPGTYNRKDAERPIPVEIEVLDPDRTYNPSEIEEALDMVEPSAESGSSSEEVEIEVGGELPPIVQALFLKKKRLASLFAGEGKPEFGPGGGRLDASSSGYDFSVLLVLIRNGVRDPSHLATTLYHRPDRGAREKGTDYIAHTVRKALELASGADEQVAVASLNFVVDEVFIYDSDPARYRFMIEGTALVLSSAELKGRGRFGLRFLDALHYMPTLPEEPDEWLALINRWLADATEISMPPEASEENALRTAIKQVIQNLPVGTTVDDLDRQMAVDLGGDELGFKADSVLDRIREKRPKIERGDVCRVLRDLGYESGSARVEGKPVRLWRRP
jgi:hypothetical protein